MKKVTQAVRYDGSACLNVRSVRTACTLLTAENPSEKTIKWSELSTILWFVETCVTSKALFFDGTVPRETTEQALDEVEKLKRRYEVKQFEVSAIEFDDPRDTLSAASDALSESRLLLEHFKIDPGADKPVEPSEHENFFNQLNAARSLGQSERRDTALEWVADAFRGSKCLAALIENGDTALNAAYQLYERHAGQGPLVTGALINRFRLNYVNQLAAQKRSAYVPDPSFESLTKEHVRLFKDYLIERIIQKIRTQPEDFNILVENMKAETPLPPIGLYALMATRATNRPGAILETAYNEFRQNDALMRVIWKNTKGGIAVKKSTGNDDHGSEIEEYFYDHYKSLEKEAAGIKVLTSKTRTARTYLIPALLKGLARAIPTAIGLGGLWSAIYDVLRETGVQASIPFLSDRLLNEGCNSYISQYKSLKWDLEHDDAIKKPLEKLTEKVEIIFGRKLSTAT